MKDFLLVVPPDLSKANYALDINIINGYPEYVTYEGNTQDQRAAVAAVMTLGTVPGKLDIGVNWAETLSKQNNMISLDNQVKQSVQDYAGSTDDKGNLISYTPIYSQGEDGQINVSLVRN